ncbi:PREDICTED: uncharacterized protein LOC105133048 isoform X2 [Populus euphratica]|uniref:Uncharacterized protein LOC105133048 isoform X2 n=1 Tax=Populus euphratica TaxID=75702 RepID=A0AAJ6US34_POPEU|nr:PREDICTED: uncharacterized protein LOC105133048 isoform X2 [Populus euphratica]
MAVGFNFSFLYRSAPLSLLFRFGSASLYRSVIFLCCLILLCFRWQRSWRRCRCGPDVDGFLSSWYIWRRPWKKHRVPVCVKESWWMRKGTMSVGAAVVGRCWVLWWEEAVNGTPAAAVWLDGGKSESFKERGSRGEEGDGAASCSGFVAKGGALFFQREGGSCV